MDRPPVACDAGAIDNRAGARAALVL